MEQSLRTRCRRPCRGSQGRHGSFLILQQQSRGLLLLLYVTIKCGHRYFPARSWQVECSYPNLTCEFPAESSRPGPWRWTELSLNSLLCVPIEECCDSVTELLLIFRAAPFFSFRQWALHRPKCPGRTCSSPGPFSVCLWDADRVDTALCCGVQGTLKSRATFRKLVVG